MSRPPPPVWNARLLAGCRISRYRTGACELRLACTAVSRWPRPARLRPGEPRGAVSDCPVAACDGLEHHQEPGSRDDLAARPASPDRQKQFCRRLTCAPISSISNCLPPISRCGPPTRDSARMLVVQPGGALRDRIIAELPQWLQPGDQLVVNDTKVISAQFKAAASAARLAEDRGNPDQAARRLALAGAGQAGQEARTGRRGSLRQ